MILISYVDIAPELRDALTNTHYDLIANICVDPKLNGYKVHLLSKGNQQWFEIHDLDLQEIMPQMIFLSETYIQIWERRADAEVR